MQETATLDAPPADVVSQADLRARRRATAQKNLARAREVLAARLKLARDTIARREPQARQSATVATPTAGVSDDELVGVAVEIMRGDAPGQTRLAAVDVIRDMSGRKLVGQSVAYKPDPARLAALDRAAGATLAGELGERDAVVSVITSAGSRVIRGDVLTVAREVLACLGIDLQRLTQESAEKSTPSEG